MNLSPAIDLAFHLASGAFGLAGILVVLVAWRHGRLADALVKYLGLADPDGRVSNKKVIVTAGAFPSLRALT